MCAGPPATDVSSSPARANPTKLQSNPSNRQYLRIECHPRSQHFLLVRSAHSIGRIRQSPRGGSGLSRCSRSKPRYARSAHFLHLRRVVFLTAFLVAVFFGERFAVVFFVAAAFFLGDRFTAFLATFFLVVAFFFGDRFTAFLAVVFLAAAFFFGERFALAFFTVFFAAFFLVAIYNGSSVTNALS